MPDLPRIPSNTSAELEIQNLPASIRQKCGGKESCTVIYRRDERGRATLTAYTPSGPVVINPAKLMGKGVVVDPDSIKIIS